VERYIKSVYFISYWSGVSSRGYQIENMIYVAASLQSCFLH
jgi:hypothetical protein